MAFRRGPTYFEEPRVTRWLFGSSYAAILWLFVRVWLGWEWFRSGWGKVFGGEITWRPWAWDTATTTGDANIGWVRSGTLTFDGEERTLGVGDSVAGFADRAIESSEGPHPDVAFEWYVDFLEWIRDTAHPVVGPAVAVGELVIGALLILGAFTGIAAFLGAILNLSFVFAGSAGINPAMIAASMAVVLAWRNAGWYGLDRWLLPAVGTPWHRGEMFRDRERDRDPDPDRHDRGGAGDDHRAGDDTTEEPERQRELEAEQDS